MTFSSTRLPSRLSAGRTTKDDRSLSMRQSHGRIVAVNVEAMVVVETVAAGIAGSQATGIYRLTFFRGRPESSKAIRRPPLLHTRNIVQCLWLKQCRLIDHLRELGRSPLLARCSENPIAFPAQPPDGPNLYHPKANDGAGQCLRPGGRSTHGTFPRSPTWAKNCTSAI